MHKVGIVCDSTCDMGPQWLAENDIVMVPLKVLFGDTTYLDWIDLTPESFYTLLKDAPALPKTSQPSPADFLAVYKSLADAGCEEIVSIHLTAALSGTHESAVLASVSSPVPVRVIDTCTVSAAVALSIGAALAARDAGGDGAAIEAAARKVVDTDRLLFALDTLEYLVKGGRAGKAKGLAASLLNIKPVLTFNEEGTIEPFKNAKGTKKALQLIAEQVAQDSANGRVRVALLHSLSPDLVEALKQALDAAGADYEVEGVHELGAVIGTYGGPRAIGIGYYPIG
ncbi:MAG: DegV family protein [Coriobacteriia bacterium]|nr:DegV family protein [Coriobacteriia bacterium]MBN2822740.1 DegV family protein [Coriobacteriia bacterium]